MIELYEPAFDDLWFREKLLADPDTMSYNRAWGGTIAFPKERWGAWYAKWVLHPEGRRFYRYIREGDAFLGEVAYHLDEARQIHLADVIVHSACRGRGYGAQALLLLCEAARRNGVTVLYDEIAADNRSISLFLRHGFEEIVRTDESILVRKSLTG